MGLDFSYVFTCFTERGVPKVKPEQGRQLAPAHNIPFFEVSAKNGDDVKAAFHHLAGTILRAQCRDPVLMRKQNETVMLEAIPVHSREEKKCCR